MQTLLQWEGHTPIPDVCRGHVGRRLQRCPAQRGDRGARGETLNAATWTSGGAVSRLVLHAILGLLTHQKMSIFERGCIILSKCFHSSQKSMFSRLASSV